MTMMATMMMVMTQEDQANLRMRYNNKNDDDDDYDAACTQHVLHVRYYARGYHILTISCLRIQCVRTKLRSRIRYTYDVMLEYTIYDGRKNIEQRSSVQRAFTVL